MLNLYLAGPIEGVTEEQCTQWRNEVTHKFSMRTEKVNCVNPYRDVELKEFDKGAGYGNELAKRIAHKNYMDCQKCDIILAYLPKDQMTKRPSYGTVMEIAWFAMMQKPIIIVTDDDYIKNHPLFYTYVGWFSEDLDDAIHSITMLAEQY